MQTNKQNLRNWAKKIRAKLNTEKLSSELVQKLKNTKEYKNSKNIMIYYPLKDEINLLALMNDKTKNFYLPKIEEKNLLCCPYNKNCPLCKSRFHTMEPLTKPKNKSEIDLIIIPALAVDKNKYRLGYGMGYYDRFLKDCSAKKIVCISKKLIVETVFQDEYDVPVDLVITD